MVEQQEKAVEVNHDIISRMNDRYMKMSKGHKEIGRAHV